MTSARYWRWRCGSQLKWPTENFESALGAEPAKPDYVILDAIVAERNRQLQRYRELLTDLPVQLLQVPEGVLSSVHLAVIRLQRATAEQHRQMFEGLRAAGIGVKLHYSPVHLQPYYRAMGFAEEQFPEAEAYANSAISLPLFPGLSEGQQQRVIGTISQDLAILQASGAN